MTTSSRNRILLLTAIIILILANLATLAVFWNSHRREVKPPEPLSEFIIREIGFNEEQKEAYRQLIPEHRKKADEIIHRIGAARDSFFGLLKEETMNDSVKLRMTGNINELIGQLDMGTFDHLKKVRNICTEEQKKKFDARIPEFLKMLAAPRRPGKPPPPQQ